MSASANTRTTSTKRAKIIPIPDQHAFIAHVAAKRHGSRNSAIALLSFKAGLRACEIAGLDWSMVCEGNRRIGDCLEISGSIAKMGSARRIPINRELLLALTQLHAEMGTPKEGAVCRSERGGHMTAGSIVNFFTISFRELGFQGCSSHSGRRTMITMAARALAQVGGSLRDVQELAGHRSLATTEGYIQGDRDVQRKLLELL